MSQLKNVISSRKDSDGKNLFTWKQFRGPINNNGAGVAPQESSRVFTRPIAESQTEQLTMSQQEEDLLKEANSNLMKKVLQREQECQDMQDRLQQSSRANADLNEKLAEQNLENQELRLQALALQEENDLLHTQLSGIRRSYASFGPRTASGVACFSPWSPGKVFPEESQDPEAGESWEDVSERLLQKMQQEMKQMEDDMSQKLLLHPDKIAPASLAVSSQDRSTGDNIQVSGVASPDTSLSLEGELESARSVIHHLQSQTEHIKTQMATQGSLLRNALEQLHKYCAADPSLHIKTRGLSQSSTGSDNLSAGSKFNRPSDELFRAYFTQQLHSSASTVVVKPQDSELKMAPTASSEDISTRMTNSQEMPSKGMAHEKVCPMCEVVLPPDTPQEEFENHVFQCLDHENTLLLEQYEMV